MASMRPGRLTPENLNQRRFDQRRRPRFNEAGAINPGKPRSSNFRRRGRLQCFNEAGAINPGKPI